MVVTYCAPPSTTKPTSKAREESTAELTCPPKTGPVIMLVDGLEKGNMARRSYTPEQVINRLREAGVLVSPGIPIAEISGKIGATERI